MGALFEGRREQHWRLVVDGFADALREAGRARRVARPAPSPPARRSGVPAAAALVLLVGAGVLLAWPLTWLLARSPLLLGVAAAAVALATAGALLLRGPRGVGERTAVLDRYGLNAKETEEVLRSGSGSEGLHARARACLARRSRTVGSATRPFDSDAALDALARLTAADPSPPAGLYRHDQEIDLAAGTVTRWYRWEAQDLRRAQAWLDRRLDAGGWQRERLLGADPGRLLACHPDAGAGPVALSARIVPSGGGVELVLRARPLSGRS